MEDLAEFLFEVSAKMKTSVHLCFSLRIIASEVALNRLCQVAPLEFIVIMLENIF